MVAGGQDAVGTGKDVVTEAKAMLAFASMCGGLKLTTTSCTKPRP